MADIPYADILDHYLFLKNVVLNLTDDYFLHMTKEEINKEKWDIINELMTDTSFKLLAKFEADIRIDFNNSIQYKKKDNLWPWSRIRQAKAHIVCSEGFSPSNVGKG
jgi:hypothetical protein